MFEKLGSLVKATLGKTYPFVLPLRRALLKMRMPARPRPRVVTQRLRWPAAPPTWEEQPRTVSTTFFGTPQIAPTVGVKPLVPSRMAANRVGLTVPEPSMVTRLKFPRMVIRESGLPEKFRKFQANH